MNDIAKEIEEMTDGITSQGTNAPVTEYVSTEVPTTEVPDEKVTTDQPSTSTPETESPVTQGVATDTPETESPTTDAPDEMTEMKAEMELLRKQLKDATSPKTDPPSTSAPTTEVPISDQDFIGDIDLDELTRDPDKLNKLLNNVFKKGVETARDFVKSGSEGVLKAIPDIVKHNLTVITTLKKASDKFYEENEDLKPFKKVVAAVFEEIAAENPDKSYEENFKGLADEVRKRLDLQKKATPAAKKKAAPRLPRRGKQGNRQHQPKTDSLVSEIDAMNSELRQ
ncbi:MAG: hypothetical protein ACTSPB_17135 [Candidatus Thorarchaeota archaeon]